MKNSIFIDNEKIIYRKEVITYEELCKTIKLKAKLNIYILNDNVYFKVLKYTDKEEIYKFIEETFVGNSEYLIHYENTKTESYIYAIRSSKVIKDILWKFNNSKVKPISFYIKNLLLKETKETTFKYKIKFMKKDFFIDVKNNVLFFEKKIVDEDYKSGRLIINEKKEKVMI